MLASIISANIWGNEMKKILSIAAVVGAALASVSPVAAATIIQTGTFTAAAPGTSSASVQQFNTSLGTLTSIDLLFGSNLSVAAGTLTNTSNAQKNFTLTKGATATLTGGGFNIAETIGTGTGSYPLAGRASTSVGPFTGSGSATQTLNSNFAYFLGTGTAGLSFASTSLFSINPNSGTLNISPLIGGNYSLTYNYTAAPLPAVPEPATWAMMLLGFGMIGFAARHRRREKNAVTFA